MKEIMTSHGGDLDAIEREYGIPRSEIWDFSGNINPLGFPEREARSLAENIGLVSTYPDKKYTSLKKSISLYTGAAEEHITVGNGSTELISAFIKTADNKKTLILGPAYSEYERESKISGRDYEYFPLKEKDCFLPDIDALEQALTDEIGLFIACNPNNPTGTAITAQQLRRILTVCKSKNIFIMIDETYIEFCSSINEICAIPLVSEFDNLFVIRGISKFFAAPGLRLGYGICSNEKFLKAVKRMQDPWSVNSLAAFAGERLFLDHDFIRQTRGLILSERERMLKELATWKNVKAYNSWSNFILIKLLTDKITAAEIFEKLIIKKLLIRDAASFKFLDESYLRFCILMPEQNSVLLHELKALVE